MQMKKWIAVLLVICFLLSAAACGNGGSPEQKYSAAIQQSLDSGDTETAKKILKEALKNFPDNQLLLDMQEKVNGAQDSSAENGDAENASEASSEKTTVPKDVEPPTIEQVQKVFEAFSSRYATWFTSINLEYDDSSAKSVHTTSANPVSGNEYAYRVKNANVRTRADLDELFLSYCTKEVYDSFSDPIESWGYDLQPCRYLDVDGELYVIVPDLVFSATDEDVQIEQQGENSFLVRFIRAIFVREYSARGGNEEYLRCTMRYDLTEDGYRFDRFSAESMMIGERIDTGTYVVKTDGSDLMLHNVPSDSEQSRTGALKNGATVTVQTSIVDWAFIESEEFDHGWVSSKYLVPYSDAQRQANNSGGNAIDQIINGGLQIADGVIRSIL